MRTPVAILFLLFALAEPAKAQDKTHSVGARLSTCATFAQVYKANPAQEIEFSIWAQGFMTGINVMRMSMNAPIIDLRAKSLVDQKAHMRNFCDKNPLKHYVEAVLDLLSSLPNSN